MTRAQQLAHFVNCPLDDPDLPALLDKIPPDVEIDLPVAVAALVSLNFSRNGAQA